MIAKNKRLPFRLFLTLLITGLILGVTACNPASPQADPDPAILQITVSILPQAYFVERIGGDAVSVNVMVGPGEEAHTYEPKPEQMKSLTHSQIFFSIGVEYEASWLPRFQDINPALQVVDSTEGIQRIAMAAEHHHDDEENNPEEKETLLGLDPHVWLAPDNGKIIAANILHALQSLAPERSSDFEANYATLMNEIDSVDARIESALSGLEQRTFMVFHPAWGYFAKQYNLEQIPVQVGGQDPSASELADLVTTARAEGVRVIFIQPTFNAANAKAIAAEIDAEVAVVDPLARNWLTNLENVAKAFAAALRD